MKNNSLNKEIRDLMDTVMKDMYLLDKEIEATFGLTSARVFTLLAFNAREIMKMRELFFIEHPFIKQLLHSATIILCK